MALGYVQGQRVVIEAEVRRRGVLMDPAVMRFYARKPSGELVELTYPSADLTRTDLGLYEAIFTVDEPGTWSFRSVASGGVEAVRETTFSVASSTVL